MKVFFLDLWLDLKDKRLVPVAILLLAGVIAVPLLLSNSKEQPPPPPVATTASVAPATPVIAAPDQTQVDSRLTVFSPRDPFEPTGSTSTGTSSSGTSSGSATTTTTTTSSGSGGGSSSGGGTTGSQPSSGTGTTGPTGTTTPEVKTTLYTYNVDLKFGGAGDVKTYKDVKRLDLIPDASDPKIVFLGVTTTAKTAVFLIDASIGVDTGEGRCRPSADECTFLYLRPDADHDQATLTDSDGNVYHLRLLAINRVVVTSSTGQSGSGNSNGKSNGKNSPAFTGRANSKSSGDDTTVPGSTPPGEPSKRTTFQQFFADSSN